MSNNCGCGNHQSSSQCHEENCACPVLISSDCLNDVNVDLTCSNILKGQTLSEVLVQLDAFICSKFDSLANFFTIINVGAGAKIYKGATLLGKKQLKSLVDSNLINIVEGTDEITISVDEAALNTFIAANVPAPALIPVSATQSGIVNNTALQELGGVDKLIHGVRAGRGNGNTIAQFDSVAFGVDALLSNDSGDGCTAIGYNALKLNVVGYQNTAVGTGALSKNLAENNTAIGANAMQNNTTGNSNVALGTRALRASIGGGNNVAIGFSAIGQMTTGADNVAIGSGAGQMTPSGFLTLSDTSIYIGSSTKPLDNNQVNQIVIGQNTTGAGSNTVTVGNNSITSTVLKGLITAPLTTNALIAGGSPKTLITREYLEANSSGVVDATATVKGILKLTNDLGGTADLPTTPTAIHITGNESGLTGVKTWTNTGASLTNGIALINNGTGGSYSITVTNTNGGNGLYSSNSATVTSGILSDNSSTGNGISSNNTAGGTGIKANNTGAGIGLLAANGSTGVGISATNALSGIAILANGAAAATGFNYVGQNNGANTFTVDKLGNVTGNSFIKTGGTASQYLMADGSTSTASLIKVVVVNIPSWSLDTGLVVGTGLAAGKTLISVVPTLQCSTANNGYLVGEIVSVGGTQANDSGGLADSGLGIQFTAATSDRFSVITNNRVDISAPHSGAIGNTGAAGNPNTVTPAQWAIRVVVTYID